MGRSSRWEARRDGCIGRTSPLEEWLETGEDLMLVDNLEGDRDVHDWSYPTRPGFGAWI